MNNTFDSLFSPSNDFELLFGPTSPNSLLTKKPTPSPSDFTDPSSTFFSTNDIFSNPLTTNPNTPSATNPGSTTPNNNHPSSRTSLRLRRLLTTKSSPSSSPSPSQTLTFPSDFKSHPSNTFDEVNPTVESPTTTTHQSPLSAESPSPHLRRRKPSQNNGLNNSSPSPSSDLLLKQILNRQTPLNSNTLATSNATNISPTDTTNTNTPTIKTESITNDENTATGQTTNNPSGATNKLRSDIFLRVEIRVSSVNMIIVIVSASF